MEKNAAGFSELLEIIGTTKDDMERGDAGAKIIQGCDHSK